MARIPSTRPDRLSGTAAGVPFVALPPAGDDTAAPLVVAWHLLDPPHSEDALAAALPLSGLDAWRIYLGLPLTGARLPDGGFPALMARAADDAVGELYAPIVRGAADEFPAALDALRAELGVDPARVGLMGASIGAAVAQLVLVDGLLEGATAAVLVSPLVQLRPVIDALAEQYGTTYSWSATADAVATQLDFVTRAAALRRRVGAVRLVVGESDAEAFRAPAHALRDTLVGLGAEADVAVVAGLAHALADEPGTGPAPQLPQAAAVDALAVDWFARHLTG